MLFQFLRLTIGSTRMPGFPLPFLFALLSFCPALLQAEQIVKVTTTGTKMLVHTPRAYSVTNLNYPLMIFLHGPAEAGDDLTLLTSRTANLYPPKLIALNRWNDKLPFIVVSPQLKKNATGKAGSSDWTPAYIDGVIEFVKRNYRVDMSRLYLTGVSNGATACWNYAAAFPSKVTAIIPISGKAIDQQKMSALKDLPVWCFHGENDPAIAPGAFAESANSIRSLRGTFKPRITVLLAKAHGGWSELYSGESGYNLYHWMLRFRKHEKRNVMPYVNAGIDRTITVRNSHVIAGDFFDWDGTISSVKWVQTSGPRLSLDGVNTAFLQIAALKPGVFEFQLSVTDNAGSTTSDQVRLEVVSATSPTSVKSLVLINGKTNGEVSRIVEGMVIDRDDFDGEFNVKAIVSGGVKSVKYSLNSDFSAQISNPPFMLRRPSSAPEWVPSNSSCVICATPYSEVGAKGEAGTAFCARVTFTHSSAASSLSNLSPDVPLKVRAIDDVLVSNVASGNQWVCNGRDIPGATGPILKPSEPGEYFVRQTSRTSFDVSNLVKFGLKIPASVAQVDVFPNPAQGYIQIKAQSLPMKSSYRILRGGVTVQQGELYEDRRIALAGKLPKGNYVLIINGKKDDAGTKFVIR